MSSKAQLKLVKPPPAHRGLGLYLGTPLRVAGWRFQNVLLGYRDDGDSVVLEADGWAPTGQKFQLAGKRGGRPRYWVRLEEQEKWRACDTLQQALQWAAWRGTTRAAHWLQRQTEQRLQKAFGRLWS
jgi:hypothetical protein